MRFSESTGRGLSAAAPVFNEADNVTPLVSDR